MSASADGPSESSWGEHHGTDVSCRRALPPDRSPHVETRWLVVLKAPIVQYEGWAAD
jgi:hypothetical protein